MAEAAEHARIPVHERDDGIVVHLGSCTHTYLRCCTLLTDCIVRGLTLRRRPGLSTR